MLQQNASIVHWQRIVGVASPSLPCPKQNHRRVTAWDKCQPAKRHERCATVGTAHQLRNSNRQEDLRHSQSSADAPHGDCNSQIMQCAAWLETRRCGHTSWSKSMRLIPTMAVRSTLPCLTTPVTSRNTASIVICTGQALRLLSSSSSAASAMAKVRPIRNLSSGSLCTHLQLIDRDGRGQR